MTDVLIITDTGKRTTASASIEETELANSGTPMTLHGVEISVDDAAALSGNPVIGRFSTSGDATTKWSAGEVDTVGAHKPMWKVGGLLRVNNTTDMALVKAIRDLSRTKGYKTLAGDLPDWSNALDDGSTVNVHVSKTSIKHNSRDNLIRYDIEMVETE